jgi:hypothetical protein
VPLLAQALVRLDGGQASLVFDGGAPHGPRDTTYVAGTAGSLVRPMARTSARRPSR